MTEEEFRQGQVARGVGAAAAVAILVAWGFGPAAAAAILRWGARNPEKARAVAAAAVQLQAGIPRLQLGGTTVEVGLLREAKVVDDRRR